MAGVYGTFYENFPELQERFRVWTNEDRSDERTVVAIYMPDRGGGIKRRKYSSGNTSLDMLEEDKFYISAAFDDKVHTGDYVKQQGNLYILRLTKCLPFDKAAGYRIYTVERLTGSTPDKTEQLNVKEGTFA